MSAGPVSVTTSANASSDPAGSSGADRVSGWGRVRMALIRSCGRRGCHLTARYDPSVCLLHAQVTAPEVIKREFLKLGGHPPKSGRASCQLLRVAPADASTDGLTTGGTSSSGEREVLDPFCFSRSAARFMGN